MLVAKAVVAAAGTSPVSAHRQLPRSSASAFGSILSREPTKTSGRMRMRVALAILLVMAAMPIASMRTASAQDSAVYAVSYIDVAPSARATATTLLQQLAN